MKQIYLLAVQREAKNPSHSCQMFTTEEGNMDGKMALVSHQYGPSSIPEPGFIRSFLGTTVIRLLCNNIIHWNEYVTIAVNRNFSNCKIARKKDFRGFPFICIPAVHIISFNIIHYATKQYEGDRFRLLCYCSIWRTIFLYLYPSKPL